MKVTVGALKLLIKLIILYTLKLNKYMINFDTKTIKRKARYRNKKNKENKN